MSFKHTELFGGAITVDLPAGFGDTRFVPASATALIYFSR